MKNTKFIVKTQSKTYPIYFGNNILNKTGSLIRKNLPGVKKICIISDNNLPNFFLKRLVKSLKKYHVKVYKITSSERIKNLKVANKIIEQLLNNNFNRSDCVIALGGGILGDLSSFISNLTKRGLKFINIQTTLLAQVDASIGGKTGINSNKAKNLQTNLDVAGSALRVTPAVTRLTVHRRLKVIYIEHNCVSLNIYIYIYIYIF